MRKWVMTVDDETGRMVEGGYGLKLTAATGQTLVELDKWPEGIDLHMAKWDGTKLINTSQAEAEKDVEWCQFKARHGDRLRGMLNG